MFCWTAPSMLNERPKLIYSAACRCPGCLDICMLLRVYAGLVGCTHITLGVVRELSLGDAKEMWECIRDSEYGPTDLKKKAQIDSLYRQAGACSN